MQIMNELEVTCMCVLPSVRLCAFDFVTHTVRAFKPNWSYL